MAKLPPNSNGEPGREWTTAEVQPIDRENMDAWDMNAVEYAVATTPEVHISMDGISYTGRLFIWTDENGTKHTMDTNRELVSRLANLWVGMQDWRAHKAATENMN